MESPLIALLLVPAVIVVFGSIINNSIQEKTLQQKYIEIAVDILNSEPIKEREPLRRWAISVLKEYSPIKISPDAIEILEIQRLPVTLSGVSAQTQAGQLRVTTTQEKADTTPAESLKGIGTKAEPGQLKVTDE